MRAHAVLTHFNSTSTSASADTVAPAAPVAPDQPPASIQHGGFEKFKPLLHLYGDGDGQPMMDGDEMNHAAFVGTSGFGKTVAVVHNATLLSGFMGWTNGFVVAIMPRGTWKARGNSIYHQLLDERQVFFIEDFPTNEDKATRVAHCTCWRVPGGFTVRWTSTATRWVQVWDSTPGC